MLRTSRSSEHAQWTCTLYLGLICFGTLASVDISTCFVKWGYEATFSWWLGSLFDWVEVFHIKIDDGRSLKNLTQRGIYLFHTHMVLQPWLSSVSSHGSHSVCYPMALMGWRHLHPLPNACCEGAESAPVWRYNMVCTGYTINGWSYS